MNAAAARPEDVRHGCLVTTFVALSLSLALVPLSLMGAGTEAAPRAPAPAMPFAVQQPAYTLAVDPATAVATVSTAEGRELTTLPLEAVVGEPALPPGSHARVGRLGNAFTVVVTSAQGAWLESARVQTFPSFFTVTFLVAAGPLLTAPPSFFFDGARGIDMSRVSDGFSPDTSSPPGRTPWLGLDQPLTPPPLDVELRSPAGWLGIGLVQVPDAGSLAVEADGAVTVGYPLSVLHGFPDRGSGGMSGAVFSFPSFAVTTAASALGGLAAYDSALTQLRAAPAPDPAQPRPAWWLDPIFDTWGEQEADHAIRSSRWFTAAYVQGLATDFAGRYGVRGFTVVIDARWQSQFGEPSPDPIRFGGVPSMRALIDWLHATGHHVVLWWPVWAFRDAQRSRAPAVDPTSAGFTAAMAPTLRVLLGTGPGDLDADGIKLDWTFRMPAAVADPALGWGFAALYRYLAIVHALAHAVKPDAMIEASASSAQFAGVTDAVRLYDGSEPQWERRAAIVAAGDPGALIDGDGWQVGPAQALQHAVSSTVYGVPAVYYDSHWEDGKPIAAAMARAIGAVVGLAALKRPGEAVLLPCGWGWLAQDSLQATSLGGDAGLLLWTTRGGAPPRGLIVSATGGPLTLPLAPQMDVLLASPGAPRPRVEHHGATATLWLLPGRRYTIAIVPAVTSTAGSWRSPSHAAAATHALTVAALLAGLGVVVLVAVLRARRPVATAARSRSGRDLS